MTGAPLPAGADAVAMVEDSERLDGGRVRLGRDACRRRRRARRRRRRPRRRPRASPPAPSSRRPSPACWPASTPAGRRSSRRPASPCCRPATSWSPTARRCARARSARATPRCSPRCSPRPAASSTTAASSPTTRPTLEAVLRDAAATNDAIVTSGGVSMGDYDVVKAVLGRIAEMQWMQVAIKPAKPFAFGAARRHAGVRAARQPGQLARQLRAARPPGAAPDDGPPPRRPAEPRRRHRRRPAPPAPTARSTSCASTATFADDGRYHVRPVGAQGSHQLAATALADALVVLPDGDGVPAGADVAVVMLRG